MRIKRRGGEEEAPDIDAALDEEVPFGMFAGSTLRELSRSDRGLTYIAWLASDAEIRSPRLRAAVELVAGELEDEIEAAREREAEERRSGGRDEHGFRRRYD